MDTLLTLPSTIPPDLEHLTPQIIALGIALVLVITQFIKWVLGRVGIPSDVAGTVIPWLIGILAAVVSGKASPEVGAVVGGSSSNVFRFIHKVVLPFILKLVWKV